MKDVKPYFQPEPLSEVLITANLRQAASSIWICAEPEVRFLWTVLSYGCSNHVVCQCEKYLDRVQFSLQMYFLLKCQYDNEKPQRNLTLYLRCSFSFFMLLTWRTIMEIKRFFSCVIPAIFTLISMVLFIFISIGTNLKASLFIFKFVTSFNCVYFSYCYLFFVILFSSILYLFYLNDKIRLMLKTQFLTHLFRYRYLLLFLAGL